MFFLNGLIRVLTLCFLCSIEGFVFHVLAFMCEFRLLCSDDASFLVFFFQLLNIQTIYS